MIPAPHIARSLQLTFVGDWGQANFHRFCGWLAQEVCDRAGPRSRAAVLTLRDGGMEALLAVQDGEAALTIATPAALTVQALDGSGPFPRALPNLRALATLPQDDRMLFAVAPAYDVATFDELRRKRPPLRIATSFDDGTNFIGYVAARMMAAHGITPAVLESWGGRFVYSVRPDQSLALMRAGEADAVVQEAIMTAWWAELVERQGAQVLAPEPKAIEELKALYGLEARPLSADHWPGRVGAMPALDFSDFAFIVRDDMPDDLAFLLTWAIVETREKAERQYRHLPANRSPLTYPLVPERMAATALPLHPGAADYYRQAGIPPAPQRH